MYRIATFLCLAVIFSSVAEAAGESVTFAGVATFEGTTTSTGSTWILLAIPPGEEAHFILQMDRAQRTMHETMATGSGQPYPASANRPLPPSPLSSMNIGETLTPTQEGWSTVRIEGLDLHTSGSSNNGQATSIGAGQRLAGSYGVGNGGSAFRNLPANPGQAGVAIHQSGGDISISGEGVARIELHNWQSSCKTGCAASVEDDQKNLPAGGRATIHRYLELEGESTLSITADGGFAAVWGGPTLDLTHVGTARLPQATCSLNVCHAVDSQTVKVQGNFSLLGMSPSTQGTTTTTIAGNDASIRIDEQPWAPLASIPASSAATALSIAAALAILWKITGGTLIPPALLTRLPREEAIKNTNRKKIIEYVEGNPGTNFREILRETGVPSGTARHHLNVLIRSDILVERGHKSTLRFFENHGKYDASWNEIVMLREPELNQVHSWFTTNPHSMQKTFLDHAQTTWGWSRSSSQHRLRRLVDEGLIKVHPQGRVKFYDIVDPSVS